MVYILDIVLVLILAFFVWQGYRRGFIRAVSTLAALVLAVILASWLSGPIAEAVYDKQIGPTLQQTVISQVEEAGTGALSEGINTALAQLPAFITNALHNAGIGDGDVLAGQVAASGENELAVAVSRVMEETVRPTVISLLKTALSLLLFVVLFVVLKLVLWLVDKIFKLPLLGAANRFFGLLAGAVNGIVVVLILVTLLQIGAATATAESLITPALLEGTVLVEWVAEINPIAGALEAFLPLSTAK